MTSYTYKDECLALQVTLSIDVHLMSSSNLYVYVGVYIFISFRNWYKHHGILIRSRIISPLLNRKQHVYIIYLDYWVYIDCLCLLNLIDISIWLMLAIRENKYSTTLWDQVIRLIHLILLCVLYRLLIIG
jgi:hypothetical protein